MSLSAARRLSNELFLLCFSFSCQESSNLQQPAYLSPFLSQQLISLSRPIISLFLLLFQQFIPLSLLLPALLCLCSFCCSVANAISDCPSIPNDLPTSTNSKNVDFLKMYVTTISKVMQWQYWRHHKWWRYKQWQLWKHIHQGLLEYKIDTTICL